MRRVQPSNPPPHNGSSSKMNPTRSICSAQSQADCRGKVWDHHFVFLSDRVRSCNYDGPTPRHIHHFNPKSLTPTDDFSPANPANRPWTSPQRFSSGSLLVRRACPILRHKPPSTAPCAALRGFSQTCPNVQYPP